MTSLALVDTNILVYAHDSLSPFHLKAKVFLETQIPKGSLAISIQNLTEFYSVTTDGRSPKLWTPKQSREAVNSILISRAYTVIFPKPQTPSTLISLLEKCPIRGPETYDLYLSATMIDNGIDTIYTADTKIFAKVGLNAINPL